MKGKHMKLFKFKRKLKFTEDTVLKLLEENGCISTAMLQHTFGVGYGKAAMMIDLLAEKGYIRHDRQGWEKINKITIRRKSKR